METEAKYNVPDEATFYLLQKVERFGQYVRRDTQVKVVHDRYLDTPDHSFYKRQLYARLRELKPKDNDNAAPTLLLTLKRLGTHVEGAIYSRDEFQVEVPSLDVAGWPYGEVRSIAEEVAVGQPLNDLVMVDQVRTVSILYKGKRAAAEYSLDEVIIQTSNKPVRAYELEIELLPDGTLTDLRAVGRILTRQYKLTPQPLTKFERAMRLSGNPE